MLIYNNKKVEFTTFPNEETTIKNIDELTEGENNKTVVFKFENNGSLIELLLLKSHLDNIQREATILEILYMPYSRMDRTENGSVFTLKYVSNLINSMNFKHVYIHEAHSDVSLALINNSENVPTTLKLLEKVLKDESFSDDDYIMFPDAGAAKRYHGLSGNVLIGLKNRDFATGRITNLELHGNFNGKGKKAVIADDLSSYGGTFVRSAQALREQGVEEIHLVVTHAENVVFKGELFDHIDKLHTTNSILSEENYHHNVKYKNQLSITKLY